VENLFVRLWVLDFYVQLACVRLCSPVIDPVIVHVIQTFTALLRQCGYISIPYQESWLKLFVSSILTLPSRLTLA